VDSVLNQLQLSLDIFIVFTEEILKTEKVTRFFRDDG